MVYVAVPVAAVVLAGTSFAPFIVAPKCVAGPDEPPHAASAKAAAMKLLFSMEPPSGCEPPRRLDSIGRWRFPKDKGRFQRDRIALAPLEPPSPEKGRTSCGSVQAGAR